MLICQSGARATVRHTVRVAMHARELIVAVEAEGREEARLVEERGQRAMARAARLCGELPQHIVNASVLHCQRWEGYVRT